MRSSLLLLLAVPALASCAALAQTSPRPPRREPPPTPDESAVLARQVNFGAGLRTFEDDDFGRLDDQLVWTLDYCEPMELGPVRLEGGMSYAYDEADDTSGGQDVRLKSRSYGLSVGLNLSHELGRLRPYAGLGAALQFLELRGIDEESDLVFDDDDVTVGGYAKAGVLFRVSRASHVGIEFRHFEGSDVTLDGTNLETSYDEVLFVLGSSFE